MPLKPTVASLDEVPEPFRGEYAAAADGKGFVLQLDGAPSNFVPKDKLEEFRRNNVALTQQLEKLVGSLKGKSMEEVQALITQHETELQRKLEANGQWEQVKAQMAERHREELGKAQQREGSLLAFISSVVAESAAIAEIMKLRGNPTLLLPHVMQRLKVNEETVGDQLKFSAQVIDPAKKTVRLKDGSGAAMTIGDLVAELRAAPEYAGAFEGTGASGSGASGSGGSATGGGQSGSKGLEALSPVDRITAARRAGATK